MIVTIEKAVWKCTVCDGEWIGKQGNKRPDRCPKRKCRAGKDVRGKKPGRVDTSSPLSGESPFAEARGAEPRWLRDAGYTRQPVPSKRCHCGAKVERVWVPEDETGYLVCTGIERHQL